MAELQVQVCYARQGLIFLRDLEVPAGSDVRKVIEISGLLERAPEIDLETSRVGIFGKVKTLDTLVRERDRVEVYRPLLADPKDSRRKRAMKKEGADKT